MSFVLRSEKERNGLPPYRRKSPFFYLFFFSFSRRHVSSALLPVSGMRPSRCASEKYYGAEIDISIETFFRKQIPQRDMIGNSGSADGNFLGTVFFEPCTLISPIFDPDHARFLLPPAIFTTPLSKMIAKKRTPANII